MKIVLAIFRNQVRLLLGDPGPIVQFLFVPLLMMAILQPAQETILRQEGFGQANGAEQVIPGFAAMFTMFWTRSIGENFFAEHGFGTWERLQMSFASAVQIMVGKLLPAFVIILLQHLILFGLGAILFDLNSNGEWLALVPIFTALNVCVLTLSLALVAICRTTEQITAVGTLMTMLFATLGGALVPSISLPDLAQDLAPATPIYWAVDGARSVLLEGGGMGAAVAPSLALLSFAAVFTAVAIARFSFAEAKLAT